MEGEESVVPRYRTRVCEFDEEPLEYQYFFTNHMRLTERLKQDIDEWRSKHPDRIFILDKMELLDLLDYCFEMTEFLEQDEDENDTDTPFEDYYYYNQLTENRNENNNDNLEMVSPPSDTEENRYPVNGSVNLINFIRNAFAHIQKS